MKRCTKCKQLKVLSKFYEHKRYLDGHVSECKVCSCARTNKSLKQKRQKFPWLFHLKSAKSRCNNSNRKDYPNYGGKGIQCLLSIDEIKKLWFRDKAYNLKQPSIDREENTGHYEYTNCQFIEKGQNTSKNNLLRLKSLKRDSLGRFKVWS